MIRKYGSRKQKGIPFQLTQFLRDNPLAAITALMALLVPLLPGPTPSLPWNGASGMAFQMGGVFLLAVLQYQTDAQGWQNILFFIRRGPTPWLLALLGLGVLSWALSPDTATAQGLLLLAAGILVYATVALQTRRGIDYQFLVDTLIGVTILMSILGIGSLLMTGIIHIGAFNHRSFGAFLMLMLPVVLMIGWSPTDPRRRQASQLAAGLAVAGILLARWHPSDAGAFISLVILALLSWRFGLLPSATPARGDIFVPEKPVERHSEATSRFSGSRSGRARRRRSRSGGLNILSTGWKRRPAGHWAFDGMTILVAISLFFTMTYRSAAIYPVRHALAVMHTLPTRFFKHVVSGHAPGISHGQEGTMSSRQMQAMIQARPLRGWGIGSCTVFQSKDTSQGNDAGSIERGGPQPGNRPANLYLAMGVELGLPGLAAWVGGLAVFFVFGWRALRSLGNHPLRQRILACCLCALAGQSVSALSDPSWQFAAPSLYLWILIGLGMAAAGVNQGLPEAAAEGQSEIKGKSQICSRAHLRFATACVLTAVLLSQIIQTAR